MGAYRRAQEAVMRPWLTPDVPKPCVDLGGGAHRGWMMEFVGDDFETWDIRQRVDVHRIVDACRMRGVADGSLGTVICVSVLEHVRNPWSAVHEIARVTRPGGLVYIAAPFQFPYHEHPDDYWRFTPTALRVLLGHNYQELACDWFGAETKGCYFVGTRLAA